jgi:hypothetical protein
MFLFAYCGNNDNIVQDTVDKHSSPALIPDTTKGWVAKEQYEGHLNRKTLAHLLGLDDLEHENDTAEIRIWLQASMYSPSRVWVFRNIHRNMTAQRIDYYLRYPGTQVDSFTTFPIQFSNVETALNYFQGNMQAAWNIPQYYETAHNKGCVDGEILSFEARKGDQYKTVSYPCYFLYKDSLEYRPFSKLVESLLSLDPP